jgi:four helix bundle protein
MRNFKNLKIWRLGMKIVMQTYKLTETFPKTEIFRLTSQMDAAAVSIPSNIAEGSSRKSNKEFYHFLEIAVGSAFELETQLLASQLKGYGTEILRKSLNDSLMSEQKMITSYMKTLL